MNRASLLFSDSALISSNPWFAIQIDSIHLTIGRFPIPHKLDRF